LGSLAADALCKPLTRLTEGERRGYALARAGFRRNYIGPIVAEDADSAANLLDALLPCVRSAFIDMNTTFNGSSDVLVERGFAKQRDLIRMRHGHPSPAGTAPRVFAVAGPEVG